MGKTVTTLDSILNDIQNAGNEKTASDRSSDTNYELQSAIESVLEKRASESESYSPDDQLEKIAETVVDTDYALLQKEAEFYGECFANTVLEKFAQYDGLLSKYAGDTSDDEASWEAGIEDGLDLAKFAEDLYEGEDDGDSDVDYSDDESDDDYDDSDYGEEKTSAERDFFHGYKYAEEAYQEAFEAGAEEADNDIDEAYEAGAESAEDDINEAYEAGEKQASEDYDDDYDSDESDGYDESDYGDDSDDGEEKLSAEDAASFEHGINDGIAWIEKTAEETGSYDFLDQIDIED